MFTLVVRFDIRDETAAAEFDLLTASAVAEIKAQEPGTLIYATGGVADEPLGRVFVEVYADRAAFDAHNAADHVLRFHALKDPLLARPPRVEFLVSGPAKGLPA